MKILILLIFVLTSANAIGNCPNNFILAPNNLCYKYYDLADTFSLAETKCVNLGGHVASVDSAFTNSFLISNAKSNFWIGATISEHRQGETICDTWIWTDQSKLITFTDWDFGEPGYESCAFANLKNGKWSTVDCSVKMPYFCAILATINVCQDEWMHLASTNGCYKVFYESINWRTAENQCQNQSAHLVSIHSDDENRFIKYISQANINFGSMPANNETWIGLFTKTDNNTNYQWSDGSSFDYKKWDSDEPNYPTIEKCGQIVADPENDLTPGFWNNVNCEISMRNFVCKKNSTIVKILS